MSEFIFDLDKKACQSMNDLMDHYHTSNKSEIISKGLAILKVAAHIEKTNGELLARKGNHETKIIIR